MHIKNVLWIIMIMVCGSTWLTFIIVNTYLFAVLALASISVALMLALFDFFGELKRCKNMSEVTPPLWLCPDKGQLYCLAVASTFALLAHVYPTTASYAYPLFGLLVITIYVIQTFNHVERRFKR